MKHLAAAAFMVLSATAAHSEDGLLTRLQARRDFHNAVAAYKHCTETKPAAACEPERQLWTPTLRRCIERDRPGTPV
jgi:hypothetical protein